MELVTFNSHPDSVELSAAFAFSPNDEQTKEGMFMVFPAGVHDICCTHKGKPFNASVAIDLDTVDAMNRQLAAVNSRSKNKAFFDFDHSNSQASAWPEEFVWKDAPAPGVYARVKFSEAGLAAVKGKLYQAFSPTFHVDNPEGKPAKVICNPNARLNFGGMVNDPAFEKNLPLAAKKADGAEQNQEQAKLMDDQNKEISALKAELQAAKDAALNAQKHNAERAVKDAVTAGKLPAADTALHAKWVGLITSDAANAELLAGLPTITQPKVAPVETPKIETVSGNGAGISAALKAMHGLCKPSFNLDEKRKQADERAALYKREVAPLMAKGETNFVQYLPAELRAANPQSGTELQATNTTGTLVGTLVVQSSLELVAVQYPMLKRIWSDFSNESALYNQAVTTRYLTPPTVATYSTSTGYAASNFTTTDKSVTINAHQYVQSSFNANELSGTARNLFAEAAPGMAYVIGKDLVDTATALMVVGTYTNTAVTESLVNFGRSTFGNIRALNDGAGVPAFGSYVLLNPSYYTKLSEDQIISLLGVYQSNRSGIIENGVIPNIQEFEVIKVPALPTTGNMAGFAGTKSSVLLAARVPQDYTTALPGSNFGSVSIITDPTSGLSVMQVMYVNHDLGTSNMRLAWMRGAAAGQVSTGRLLLSA